MARPGLRNHPKFKRLMFMLKPAPESHVRGYLECLWETAYECGNAYIGDAETVEAAAYWPGKRGKLFDALLTCGGAGRAGFIEQVPDRAGEYQIHDLYDHAPDYVRKRQKREQQRTAKSPIPEVENSAKKSLLGRVLNDNDLQQKCPVTDRSTADNGAPPTPAPTPINTPLPPKGGGGGPKPKAEEIPPDLDTPRFREAWGHWEDHRREIRHKLTPQTRAKQLADLARMGEASAVAAIEQSIRQGWQGLFEPKYANGSRHPPPDRRHEGNLTVRT